MDRVEEYNKEHGPAQSAAQQTMSEYMGSMTWKPRERIFDLGCGPGKVTVEMLLPRLPDDFEILVAADVSAAMLQLARSKYTHPKVKFLELDLGKPIPPDSDLRTPGFDKVFSFFCLQWIADQRQAVTNIYNLLRPGGEALVTIFARADLLAAYNSQIQKKEWQPYLKKVQLAVVTYQNSQDPAEDFKKILKDVGFKVVDCKCRKTSYNLENVSRFKDFAISVNPFLNVIPKELHDIYITDLLMEMTKIKFKREEDKDDSITEIKYDQIIAYIRKV
ncbi:juvenile hormone acid O-methyltransferase-like [Periplaneta americana]|uniref:juvenile hormone acid O-methyltransferase-like n=1 Tax=Periplaneta americana TaxID=6978 RepID=UPI0037E7EB7C